MKNTTVRSLFQKVHARSGGGGGGANNCDDVPIHFIRRLWGTLKEHVFKFVKNSVCPGRVRG